MGASHEISRARAEDLPHFAPGQRRLRWLPFAIGKSELRVTSGLQGGVHLPLAVLKFVPLPGSEDPDRAAGSAINQGHRARRGALLLGEMLRHLLLEVLGSRQRVGAPGPS